MNGIDPTPPEQKKTVAQSQEMLDLEDAAKNQHAEFDVGGVQHVNEYVK